MNVLSNNYYFVNYNHLYIQNSLLKRYINKKLYLI